MYKVILRAILEAIIVIITLPIRIVYILMWSVLAIIWVCNRFGSVKDYWHETNGQFYRNINKEINWIKTGKFERLSQQ